MPGVNDDVPSPCIGICQLDPVHGWCKGCYRTIDEIADWSRALPAARRAVIEAAGHRRAQHPPQHPSTSRVTGQPWR